MFSFINAHSMRISIFVFVENIVLASLMMARIVVQFTVFYLETLQSAPQGSRVSAVEAAAGAG